VKKQIFTLLVGLALPIVFFWPVSAQSSVTIYDYEEPDPVYTATNIRKRLCGSSGCGGEERYLFIERDGAEYIFRSSSNQEIIVENICSQVGLVVSTNTYQSIEDSNVFRERFNINQTSNPICPSPGDSGQSTPTIPDDEPAPSPAEEPSTEETATTDPEPATRQGPDAVQDSTSIDATPCEDNEVFISIGVGDDPAIREVEGGYCILSDADSGLAGNPIIVYLKGIIRFLAVGVGLVVTTAIVVAGIQYSSSRDNPQLIQAAMQRLTNAIIALITFIFMATILNFLIPGGLL